MIYAEAVNVKKYIVNSGDYNITYNGEEREFIIGTNPGYGSALTFKDVYMRQEERLHHHSK